jgi:hypothetical protein
MGVYDLIAGAWLCHENRLLDLFWFFVYCWGLAMAIIMIFFYPYESHRHYGTCPWEIFLGLSAFVCGKMAWRKFGDFASHF